MEGYLPTPGRNPRVGAQIAVWKPSRLRPPASLPAATAKGSLDIARNERPPWVSISGARARAEVFFFFLGGGRRLFVVVAQR